MYEHAYTYDNDDTANEPTIAHGHTAEERTANRPAVRLYVAGREVEPDGEPWTLDSAHRAAVAALTGCEPGTRGRVDVLTYPSRRGAHAYAAAVSFEVDGDGNAREA